MVPYHFVGNVPQLYSLGTLIYPRHFHLLAHNFRLCALHLSNCVLNISTTWIPKVQLISFILKSCYIGGQIPVWISTHISLKELVSTDNNLYGEIPSWLFCPPMKFLTLSGNHLQGKLFASDFLKRASDS